jgi:hypothetical protein
MSAIEKEIRPFNQNYIRTFLEDELKSEHVVEIHRKENDVDSDYVVYKFSNRLLGIFTHGIHYFNSDGSNLLQFKLAFDNLSRFLFYDEVAMIIDTITDYFGLQGISDYDSLRKKFVEGNTDVTISWRFENGYVCVKNDEERQRPELYIFTTVKQ